MFVNQRRVNQYSERRILRFAKLTAYSIWSHTALGYCPVTRPQENTCRTAVASRSAHSSLFERPSQVLHVEVTST